MNTMIISPFRSSSFLIAVPLPQARNVEQRKPRDFLTFGAAVGGENMVVLGDQQ